MDCPFYQSYRYCRKIHGEMSEDLFDTYCMSNYSFNECPVYLDKGTSSSGSGCFITTACVNYRGLPDDCYELSRLRWFRDKYLAQTEKGKASIKLYYTIAPKIVEEINRSEAPEAEYDRIYNTWIVPCISLIDSGEYLEASNRYKDMIIELSEKYLHLQLEVVA